MQQDLQQTELMWYLISLFIKTTTFTKKSSYAVWSTPTVWRPQLKKENILNNSAHLVDVVQELSSITPAPFPAAPLHLWR